MTPINAGGIRSLSNDTPPSMENKGLLFRPIDSSIQVSDTGKQGIIILWEFIIRKTTDLIAALLGVL